ncbi:MAG: P-II family nitrogen regulator [Bacteroidales bacterium]|jgi:nitrogen regulatory protein P-II 1|nr:P-II family nitrogen regulator [Bacteroidales bacterium]
MELKKITAIIRSTKLEEVEDHLHRANIKGISVSTVKGYGENKNFFGHDWKVTHARIEIFTRASEVDRIAKIIMESASTGSSGDGVIAVLPVENIWKIRTKSKWAN